MRITCKNCGGDHPVWDCKRPTTKSTVAKITSPDGTGLDNSTVGVGGSLRGSTPKLPVSETTAGKALPVDTNSSEGVERPAPTPSLDATPDRRARDKGDQPIPKRKVGRPKFITDLKAYKAMKQKEYRKKWKERGNTLLSVSYLGYMTRRDFTGE